MAYKNISFKKYVDQSLNPKLASASCVNLLTELMNDDENYSPDEVDTVENLNNLFYLACEYADNTNSVLNNPEKLVRIYNKYVTELDGSYDWSESAITEFNKVFNSNSARGEEGGVEVQIFCQVPQAVNGNPVWFETTARTGYDTIVNTAYTKYDTQRYPCTVDIPEVSGLTYDFYSNTFNGEIVSNQRYFYEKNADGAFDEEGDSKICEVWTLKEGVKKITADTDYDKAIVSVKWSAASPQKNGNFRVYTCKGYFKYALVDGEMKGEMVGGFTDLKLVDNDFIRFIPVNVKKLMAYHIIQTMLRY